MMNYQQLISQLAAKINSCEEFQDKHTIIIGDNGSGKSDLIWEIIKGITSEFYFIDSVNRSILVDGIVNVDSSNIKINTVLEERIKKVNFNKKDTFGITKIETIIYEYKDELCKLVGEFFSSSIEINEEKNGISDYYAVKVNGREIDEIDERISNGYQAVFRIMLEMLFYTKNTNTDGSNKHKVFIDEIDEYLSMNHQGDILNFLIKKFPNINFIVSTHSINLVAKTPDCNIVLIDAQNYEIYNSSSFDSLQLAQNLFLSDSKCYSANDQEEVLRILLNHKINKCWDDIDDGNLRKIKVSDLTPTNNLIYKTIIDWN